MGANVTLKLLLLLSSLAAAATAAGAERATASGCRAGRTYWHAGQQRCAACSRCAPGEIVARPCELDRDVRCGPIADLDLDYWTWLKEKRLARDEEPPPLDDAVPSRAQESQPSHWRWDWQAELLLVAILLCALFFAVAAGYSLHHARHCRILEEHYEADIEEISSRLALMTAANVASLATLTNCQYPNGRVILPPSTETTPEAHCANLEQLLAGKSSSRYPGQINIYIEDNET